eukprot:TRINITY_DN110_c1_g1_i3.p1 TRINITY_DN110_c1_g1~~TRINITY_DN110_c1_g1_i3.p1  ORF type:complete len:149 (-),score=25.75 TRINITY_DN110_c1_g1_i3:135-581(-)
MATTKSGKLPPFHHAFPCADLAETRKFYTEVLGCTEGRSTEQWGDFNFYGHQVVAHLSPDRKPRENIHNHVDGSNVPVPHFGAVLEWEDWEALAQRLREHKVKFEIEPHIRFEGLPGEQGTFFFLDPSNNALEFKSFRNIEESLFAKQ